MGQGGKEGGGGACLAANVKEICMRACVCGVGGGKGEKRIEIGSKQGRYTNYSPMSQPRPIQESADALGPQGGNDKRRRKSGGSRQVNCYAAGRCWCQLVKGEWNKPRIPTLFLQPINYLHMSIGLRDKSRTLSNKNIA